MNGLVAIRDRMLSWAGHVARMDYKEICAKALRCRGLQWWRWRQLNWKEVERDKWSGPHPQRFKIYIWEDMVAGEVSKFVGNADGLSKTVQDNTGWLHFAQNLLGDPSASGMMEASMVASRASVVASMASMASMVASRVSVVASMASMASLVESRKWLKWRAAEPKRDDERVKGLAHSDELTL